MTRDTIFISHATPEDNAFAEWLFAKLTLAGYKCWYDLEGLQGGERDFSEEIERIIRDDACKFLLVFSEYTFTKEFVKDEYEYARSIAKEKGLKDFIFPIRIADVPFNKRIGFNRYNHFNFYPSYPRGLKSLLRRFQKDAVPRFPERQSEIMEAWFYNRYTVEAGILPIDCNYFSNWWQIPSLPERLFVYQYYNEAQSQAIEKEDTVYPKIRHGNCIISFQKNMISICAKEDNLEVIPTQKFIISVSDILVGYESEEFPNHRDAQNFLKRILNKSLKEALFAAKLSRFKMSNKTDCFFYRIDKKRAVKVKTFFPGRETKRTLFGRYGNNSWHFGISFKVLLEPFLCYSIKSHIVFSDNGFKLWDSESKMFTARRKKGRLMFNKEWRDLLMAMIQSLRDDEGKIIVCFSDDDLVEMEHHTIMFKANFDYSEPRDENRQGLLFEDILEEEEEERHEDEDESTDEVE